VRSMGTKRRRGRAEGRGKPEEEDEAVDREAQVPAKVDIRALEDEDEDVDSEEDDSEKDEESDDDSSNSADSDDDEDDDDIRLDHAMDEGLIEVDFEFFDPCAEDFHSARALLQQSNLLDAAPMDTSELADLLTEQVAVGTVLKSGGKEEPALAYLSCLSLQQHKASASLRQLQGVLLKQCPAPQRTHMERLLTGAQGGTALLVNERLVNVPDPLLAPMHRSLQDDLKWAIKHAGSEDERKAFRVDHFVAIVRCERGTRDEAHARGAGKRSKHHPASAREEVVAAVRADEELLRQAAVLNFALPSRGPKAKNKPGGLPEHLEAVVVTAETLAGLPARLDQLARDAGH